MRDDSNYIAELRASQEAFVERMRLKAEEDEHAAARESARRAAWQRITAVKTVDEAKAIAHEILKTYSSTDSSESNSSL